MTLKISIYGKKNTMLKSNLLSNKLKVVNSLETDFPPHRYVYHIGSEYYSPDLYTYMHNSRGFRSVEFSSKNSILTAGCSYTYGSGLPFEYIWPQLLQKKILDKQVANLSYPGASIEQLIYYLFQYFKQIGNPEMIICNFPDFFRFNTVTKDLYLIQYYTNIHENTYYTKEFKKSIKESFGSEASGLYTNVQLILMLEQYCESNNIKLIWSTWESISANKIYQELDIPDLSLYLKSTFRYYHTDLSSREFHYLKGASFFNNDKKIQYKEQYGINHPFNKCHAHEKAESEDFFEVAYDRYIVPKKHKAPAMLTEDQANLSRSEKDKNLDFTNNTAHFGSHAQIHWAEFYYDIIKEQYPDFI